MLKSFITAFIQCNVGLEDKLTRAPLLGLAKSIYIIHCSKNEAENMRISCVYERAWLSCLLFSGFPWYLFILVQKDTGFRAHAFHLLKKQRVLSSAMFYDGFHLLYCWRLKDIRTSIQDVKQYHIWLCSGCVRNTDKDFWQAICIGNETETVIPNGNFHQYLFYLKSWLVGWLVC